MTAPGTSLLPSPQSPFPALYRWVSSAAHPQNRFPGLPHQRTTARHGSPPPKISSHTTTKERITAIITVSQCTQYHEFFLRRDISQCANLEQSVPRFRVPEEGQVLPLFDHDVWLRFRPADVVDECNWAILVQEEDVLGKRSMHLQSPGEVLAVCLPQ